MMLKREIQSHILEMKLRGRLATYLLAKNSILRLFLVPCKDFGTFCKRGSRPNSIIQIIKYRLVDTRVSLGGRLPREGICMLSALLGCVGIFMKISDGILDSPRHMVCFIRSKIEASVASNFRQTCAVRCGDRFSKLHCFEHWKAKSFC